MPQCHLTPSLYCRTRKAAREPDAHIPSPAALSRPATPTPPALVPVRLRCCMQKRGSRTSIPLCRSQGPLCASVKPSGRQRRGQWGRNHSRKESASLLAPSAIRYPIRHPLSSYPVDCLRDGGVCLALLGSLACSDM